MDDDLDLLATRQGGVWTTAQAAACGFTLDAMEARVRSGRWERVFRGAYAAADTSSSLPVRARAALLLCGGRLVVGGPTAAALHGLTSVTSDVVHLVGQSGTDRAPRNGLRVHESCLGRGDVVSIDDLPCTSLARTVVDCARVLPRLDALPVVDEGLRLGCSKSALDAEVALHVGLPGVVQAREMLLLGEGLAESPMESRMRLRWVDGGLPVPRLQIPIDGGRYRLDAGFDEFLVGGEYDGAEHLTRERQRHELDRRNFLQRRGWWLAGFTDVHVYRRWQEMVDIMRGALVSRGWQPPRTPRSRA